ncbi:hypothetical protein [Aquimarina rhabdastrellae]
MKFKHILYSTFLSSMLILTGCTDDEKVPSPLTSDDIQINGGYLKTIESSFDVNLLDLDSSLFSVTLEEHDKLNDGSLIDNVQVYIRFNDNTIDDNGTPDDESDDINNTKTEVLLETINASAFSFNNDGFPQVTYSTGIREGMDSLGLNDTDLEASDIFTFRFVLNLTDGNSYSNNNSSSAITGQPVFNSPFEYSSSVSCPLDENLFIGNYLIEQTSPFVDGPTLSHNTVVELSASSGSSRSFQTSNYPLYCSTPNTFTIDFVCGEIIVPQQDSNCVCGDGGNWFGPAVVSTTYDPNDDSGFTITFTDDAQSDCASPAQTSYKFTKQ